MKGRTINEKIKEFFALLVTEVKIENKGFEEFGINKYIEGSLKPILNILFSVTLSPFEVNKDTIDLGDESKKLAIQITSETKADKIKRTVLKFIKNKHYQAY